MFTEKKVKVSIIRGVNNNGEKFFRGKVSAMNNKVVDSDIDNLVTMTKILIKSKTGKGPHMYGKWENCLSYYYNEDFLVLHHGDFKTKFPLTEKEIKTFSGKDILTIDLKEYQKMICRLSGEVIVWLNSLPYEAEFKATF